MSQGETTGTYTGARRAYRLGVANGILFAVGIAFVDPVTVLPTFVSRLTDSDVAVGLVSVIGMSGWSFPQIFAARYLESRPYKRPLYVFAAFVRGAGSLLLVPTAIVLGPRHATAALVAFFICYSLHAFGGGMSGVAFLDIVAKTVPGHRLGAFFGNRQFWGGLLAIGCGLLVRAVLGEAGPGFPLNYGILFALAFVSFAPGWAMFAAVEEPPGRVRESQGLAAFLREGPTILRGHRAYRLLLISRMLAGAASVALPFYIIYCRRVLHIPEAAVGTYLSMQMAGSVAAIPLWAYLNDRRGPRALLRAVAAVSLAIPTIAFLSAAMPTGVGSGRIAFGAAFFLMAAAGGGSFIGYTNYLLAIAPEERRTMYIGVHNTLFAVTNVLPLVGSAVIKYASFQALFGLAAAFTLASALVVLRLPPSHHQHAD